MAGLQGEPSWVIIIIIMHETHEAGDGEEEEDADELRLMFHGRHRSSVHTQKEPLRDSDLLVLTVCRYRQKIN